MAKGIIVLDDIPVICAECSMATVTSNKQYLRCEVKNRIIYNAKPDWCPIKPIPAKNMCSKSICISSEEYYRRKGWKACIEEIEGR